MMTRGRRMGFWVFTLTVIVIGFIASVSAVRATSSAYNYYAYLQLGDFLRLNPGFAVFLTLACLAAFVFAVWNPRNIALLGYRETSEFASRTRGETVSFWRRIDFMLLYIVAFVILVNILSLWRSGYTQQLLLTSAFCYLLVVALLGETAARIRDKAVLRTCYWITFFKLFPLRKPLGLILGLLVGVDLLFILVLTNLSLTGELPIMGYASIGILPIQLFAVLALIALTYLSRLIRELSSDYEKATEEKLRSEQFKVELITNVSHDIRTPLTSIISYVDLMKGLPIKDEEFKDYVEVLDRKSQRLKVLIDDLMDASKASTGNITVHYEYLDLVEIVGQIAGEFDDRFTELSLVLVTGDFEGPHMIKADSKHVWRILENLFGNVAKYALPGTRVFAKVGVEDNAVALSIKNTSKIPLEQKGDELMQQFIRGDRARQSEGSGLGLYIAKNLSELMGGSLEIRTSGDLFEAVVRFSHKP